MDPSYRDSCREGFYPATERDSSETRQHPQQQQQQQLPHYAHQLPYHHAPLLSPLQQTAAFMLEQSEQLRSREDYGSGHATPTMLRSLYPGSGAVLPNPSLVHQPTTNHQPQHFTDPQQPPPPHQQPHPQQPSRLQATPRPPYLPSSTDQLTNNSTHSAQDGVRETAGQHSARPDGAREVVSGSPIESLDLIGRTHSAAESRSDGRVLQQPSHQKDVEKNHVTPPKPSNQVSKPALTAQFLQRLMLQPRQPARDGVTLQASTQLPDVLAFRFGPGDERKEGAIQGVVAQRKVEDGVEFGPYDGTLMDEEIGSTKESTWEICTGGKVFFYVDGKKKDQLMWLSYVQCARSEEEQNLEVCQYYGQIYFRTTRVIDPGSELRAFYSKEYAKSVGFKIPLKDLNYLKEKDVFQCASCDRQFPSAKRILRHIKFDHQRNATTDPQPVISWKYRDTEKEEEEVVPLKQEKAAPDRPCKVRVRGVTSGHFICTVCGKKFPTEGRLEAHAMFHEVSEDYMCLVCGEKQRNAKALSRHMAQHDSRSHKCCKCGKTYKTKNALDRHEREGHGVTSTIYHACRICGVEFLKKKECVKHEETHGPDDQADANPASDVVWKKKRYCLAQGTDTESPSVGNQETAQPVKRGPGRPRKIRPKIDQEGVKPRGRGRPRKIHPRSHYELEKPTDMLGLPVTYFQKPRPYKCRYCSKRYRSQSHVARHEKESHEGKGNLKCDLCPRVFMKEWSFLHHYQSHEQNRHYRCTLCPRAFSSERALTNHQDEHTGLKPFKCEICGKGFRIRKLVCAHQRRIHQPRELRFFCGTCNKGFADKGDLIKHERRHKGIRPFVCLVCGKGFGVKHVLQVHMQSKHSDEKRFECEVCGKKFALNQHYTYHMFKHKAQGEDLPQGVIASTDQQQEQPPEMEAQ